MEKDAYYFPHYCNARHDRKIKRIIKELGVEGYGIFFMLLEVLREQTDFRYPVSDIDLLADEFGTSEQKVRVVITNYKLFDIDESEMFFSPKLIFYLQPYLNMKEQRRLAGIKSGEKRRLKSSNNPEQPLNDRSTPDEQPLNENEQSKLEESKVKESKGNYFHIGDKIVTDVMEYLNSQFQLHYPNWQKNFQFANIQECSTEFMNLHVFETFNDESHFKNSFTKLMREKNTKNERARGREDESNYTVIRSY